MCVKPEALLYALVTRVARSEIELTEEHLKTLFAAGCTQEAIAEAFKALPQATQLIQHVFPGGLPRKQRRIATAETKRGLHFPHFR